MMPKWTHWICTTTVHDRLTTAAYQLSQMHTTTSNMSLLYMVTFELDPVNAGHAAGSGTVNWFKRSGCLTQLQVHKEYHLSNKEVVNQHHFALHGQVANVFDTYDWQHGYVWAFNMVIKITDALAEHEKPTAGSTIRCNRHWSMVGRSFSPNKIQVWLFNLSSTSTSFRFQWSPTLI